MKQNALVIHSRSIGDTLSATPTLRKLYKIFNEKISVVTHIPEIFYGNPYVADIMHFDKVDTRFLENKYEIHKTFYSMGHRNKEGIEIKHSCMDIRQIHATDLGFMLSPEEMTCEFYPQEELSIELPDEYICIHPVQSWESRTWKPKLWEELIEMFNAAGVAVVSVGKDSSETGFFNVDKPAFSMNNSKVINLVNNTSLSETWHIINKAKLFITMDSGLLHLAGTTDTHILQLGSSINPKFRIPYRNGVQNYKYTYVSGPCALLCASDLKYSVKEWKSIQSVAPLIKCLENKPTFECHPTPQQVFSDSKDILQLVNEDIIKFEYYSQDNRAFNIKNVSNSRKNVKVYIRDDFSGLTHYSTKLVMEPNIIFYVALGFPTKYKRRLEVYDIDTNKLIFKYLDTVLENRPESHKLLKNLNCDKNDATGNPLVEIFEDNEYSRDNCKIEPGDVVVDFGANVGLFSLYAIMKGCKKCYALEQQPTVFSYMKSNVEKYGVVCINKAISHVNSMKYTDSIYDSSTALIVHDSKFNGSVEINTITFSEFIKQNSIYNIDFLKVDIEGGEFELFKSIDKDFLKNNVRKIVVECHMKTGYKLEEIYEVLESCGFDYTTKRVPEERRAYGTVYAWKRESKKSVMFVTPHLSTGGLPQYLEKKVELLKDIYNVYVVEYENLTAGVFVVQKNRIQSMLSENKFITLGQDKNELLKLIDSINPYVIHMEEFPESFMDHQLATEIYTRPDRKYYIVETTHDSRFEEKRKIFLPDKFCVVSQFSADLYKSLPVPCEVIEYPIEYKERPDREQSLRNLVLDPSYKHVLNVGLFNANKNQSEIFEYARKLIGKKVQFHFVGNLAGNFQSYWQPLIDNKPDNCIIWGERSDVDKFYSACDLFVFTSLLELNPLVIKEALSWKLPILMYNLETYQDKYDDIQGIAYFTKDLNKNLSMIENRLDLKVEINTNYKIKLVHLLNFPNDSVEAQSIKCMSQLAEYGIQYVQHINPVTTEMPSEPSLFPITQHGTQLTPGHYGCFDAFRKAIEKEFTDDVDFLIVCERDCVLTVPIEEFYTKLIQICPIVVKEDISYFSFGDKVDLACGVLQSETKRKLNYTDLVYITNKIIGLQSIMFPKSSRAFLLDRFKNVPWYGMDIWFNSIFLQEYLPMGIVTNRLTRQLDGYSLIDKSYKKLL